MTALSSSQNRRSPIREKKLVNKCRFCFWSINSFVTRPHLSVQVGERVRVRKSESLSPKKEHSEHPFPPHTLTLYLVASSQFSIFKAKASSIAESKHFHRRNKRAPSPLSSDCLSAFPLSRFDSTWSTACLHTSSSILSVLWQYWAIDPRNEFLGWDTEPTQIRDAIGQENNGQI